MKLKSCRFLAMFALMFVWLISVNLFAADQPSDPKNGTNTGISGTNNEPGTESDTGTDTQTNPEVGTGSVTTSNTNTEAVPATEGANDQVAAKDATDAEIASTKTEEPKPKARFRSFRPSEEISADNAVPFPVDI